jgi:hypothetical protein
VNKTAAFLAFASLAAVGLIGSVVLAIHRPDATATFTGLIVTVLGLAATAAGTFYAFGKQGEKIDSQSQQLDTIGKNVNGNTSRLLEAVEALLAERGVATTQSAPPEQNLTSSAPPISEETILRIKKERDKLPSHGQEG